MARRGGCARFLVGLGALGAGAALGLGLGATVGEHASAWHALVLPGAFLAGLFGWGLVAGVVWLGRAIARRTLEVYGPDEVVPGAFMLPLAALLSIPLLGWLLGASTVAWLAATVSALVYGAGTYALAWRGLVDPSFLDSGDGSDAGVP